MTARLRSACAAACLLPLGASCSPPPVCEQKVQLVDHMLWTVVPAEDDPFVDGDPADFFRSADGGTAADDAGYRPTRCPDSAYGYIPLGGEHSFDVDTGECSWGTAAQPLLGTITNGQMLRVRIWHFSQATFDAAVADVVIRVGDEDIFVEAVPIPASTGILGGEFPSPISASAGEAVYWHVGNHGDNSWNIVELSTLIDAPCPMDDGEGP